MSAQTCLFDDLNQQPIAAQAMDADVFTLLRLFENYRGIDVPQDWFDLLQRYHGALDDPASRQSWSQARLRSTLDAAEKDGLVVYRTKWEITPTGLEARRIETLRRMGAPDAQYAGGVI